jgi:CubicO group peptidase (beta-lactamase class C family)
MMPILSEVWMKRFAVLLTLLVLWIPPRAFAQVDPTAPLVGSFSSDGLARIDRWLNHYIKEDLIAGAVMTIQQDGKPVYESAVGWSDRESGREMTMETLFRIASQTKAVASVAFLTLFEEGRVGLDDPVSRHIPEFAETTVAVAGPTGTEIVPADREITLRDLLTHTSGISYGVESRVVPFYQAKGLGPAAGYGWYLADKDEGVCKSMERLATLPFVAQPGKEWVYGYSTDVLGCVIERISGMPLDEFIRSRVTGPLGMKDTHFFVPTSERNRLATVYSSGPDGRVVRGLEGPKGQGDYVEGPRRNFSGGAGLVSTASDYVRFMEMLRNGGALGDVRILSPRTVRLMTTSHEPNVYSQDGRGFGLGFEIVDEFGADGIVSEGAFSWGGAYSSSYRVDPNAGLVMILLTQTLPNTTDIRARFPTMVYQALVNR